MLSRIAYDRKRATVRIDPHGSHAREATEHDVLDFIARWARLIRMVWLEDPLLCSRCGGEMRIISFITDRPVIDKILRHIGFTHADSPPPRYRPPPRICRAPLG